MTAQLQIKFVKLKRYEMIRRGRDDVWLDANFPCDTIDDFRKIEKKHALGVMTVSKF